MHPSQSLTAIHAACSIPPPPRPRRPGARAPLNASVGITRPCHTACRRCSLRLAGGLAGWLAWAGALLLAMTAPPPSLDPRLLAPYSIGTGVPLGGDDEIKGYLRSLRVQGFCCIERVIPACELSAVRESVHDGRRRLKSVREREHRRRVDLAAGLAQLKEGHWTGVGTSQPISQPANDPSGEPDAVRVPIPPPELNDIAMQERFAEYLAEPRVLRVAKEMLDTHVRIAQTEVNKSRAPTGSRSFSVEQLRRRCDQLWVGSMLPPWAQLSVLLGGAQRLAQRLAARPDRVRPRQPAAMEALRGGGAAVPGCVHGPVDRLVPPPSHKYGYRDPGLAEIYYYVFEIPIPIARILATDVSAAQVPGAGGCQPFQRWHLGGARQPPRCPQPAWARRRHRRARAHPG
jgi:hypothetical protein